MYTIVIAVCVFILNIITGFCLGNLYWLRKVRKIQKKTRVGLEECEVLLNTSLKTQAPADAVKFSEKNCHLAGRVEVTSELFS